MSKDSPSLFGALFENAPANRPVPVLVPLPTPTPYSYAVPDGMAVEPGSIVQVPLGPRQVIGVVWDGGDDEGVDPKKLRPITRVFDCPPLGREMRDFVDWVAAYTLSPPGLVARMALRAPAAFDAEPMVEGLRFVGGEPERLTPARTRVMATAADGAAWTRGGLAQCGRRLAERRRRARRARYF